MSTSDISLPVTKAVSAITVAVVAKADVAETVARAAVQDATYSTWATVMSIPWSTIASCVAAIYTLLLISEWFWKKLWRPLLERRGIIERRKHFILTESEWDSLKEYDRRE